MSQEFMAIDGVELEAAAESAPAFNSQQCLSDGTRYLADPLDEDYLCAPPTSGLVKVGMLPPEEMEVRYLVRLVALAGDAWTQSNAIAKLISPELRTPVEALYGDLMLALATCIDSSRAHQAAAVRLEKSCPAVRHVLDAVKLTRGAASLSTGYVDKSA